MATFSLTKEIEFPFIFKKADNSIGGSSTGGNVSESLECLLDTDLVLVSSEELMTTLETGSLPSKVGHQVVKVFNKVLANHLEGECAGIVSASVQFVYVESLQGSVPSTRKFKARLSSEFLSSVVSEFNGLVTVRFQFSLRTEQVNGQHSLVWRQHCDMNPSFGEEGACVFVFESLENTDSALIKIEEGVGYRGDVRIWIILECPLEEWSDDNIPLPSALEMTANILENQIECDFELVADRGKRFPCHKVFLAANSPVLAQMLKTECAEVKDKSYQMSLSEEGVKTFLDFVYRAKSMESIPSAAVCLELLEAANKYNVSSLEVAMKALFLKQELNWMEVDVAVMLYVYARKVKGFEPLMWKAIQVVKSKPEQLMHSQLFEDLLKKDPIAKEILVRAIKSGSIFDESSRKLYRTQ